MWFYGILYFWLFFCIATGMFAAIRRNRSGGWWGLWAALFTPLVAFTLVAILKQKEEGTVAVNEFLRQAA
jgi:hypothetical protein